MNEPVKTTEPAPPQFQLSNLSNLKPQTQQDYTFTETFYGQLITNIDTLFEDVFLSSIQEVSEEEAQGAPQLSFDEETLRMLFADVAAVYVEPVKNFIQRLEKRAVSKSEIRIILLALEDIAQAGSQLGLTEMCKLIEHLSNYLTEVNNSLPSDEIPDYEANRILLEYARLAEVLPQTFAIEGFKRPNNFKVMPTPAGLPGARMTVSIAALNSNLTTYCYPPRIHKNVDIIEQEENGVKVYWFKDNISNRYFKAKKREHDIIRLIDGTRTLNEICRVIKEQMDVELTPPKLAKIIAKMDSIGLIDGTRTQAKVEKQAVNLSMNRHYKVYNPDRFFDLLDSYLGWIFTSTFVFTSLVLMSFVLLELYSHHIEFLAYYKAINKDYGVMFHFIPILIVVSLHEIGHGLTCKHYGGRVSDMGVMFFNLVIPAGYCNVSDIYLFKNKKHRVYVLLAGLYTQYLIATFAAALWLVSTPHSIIADLACFFFLGATASTVINLIPLMKLDGYYTLTNLLGEHNLQQQSISYVKEVAGYIFYGDPIRRKDLTRFQQTLYLTFGSASFLFVNLFPFLIILTYFRFLSGGASLGFNSLLTLALSVKYAKTFLRIFLAPLKAFYKICGSLFSPARPVPARVRSGVAIVISVMAITFILFGQWRKQIQSPCVLSAEPVKTFSVIAPADGVVTKLFKHDLDPITTGQPIATLQSYNLELELTRLKNEIAELHRKEQQLQEEIGMQTAKLAESQYRTEAYQQQAVEYLAEEDQLKAGDQSMPELSILQAEIEKLKLNAEYKDSVVARFEKLLPEKLVAVSVYDRAVFESKKAHQDLLEMQNRLEKAVRDHHRTTDQMVAKKDFAGFNEAMAEKRLEQARIELTALTEQIKGKAREVELVNQQQQEYQIVSPCCGIITTPETENLVLAKADANKVAPNRTGLRLDQSLGRPLGTGSTICRILDISQLRLELEVSEWEINNIAPGQKVKFRLNSLNNKVFTGEVEKIGQNPIINKEDGKPVYKVYLLVANPELQLKPGMTGVAMIEVGKRTIRELLANWIKQKVDYVSWLPS